MLKPLISVTKIYKVGKVFRILNKGEYWILIGRKCPFDFDMILSFFIHTKAAIVNTLFDWIVFKKYFTNLLQSLRTKKRTRTGVEDVSQNPAFLKCIAAKSWPWSFRKDNKVKRKTKLEKKGPFCLHAYLHPWLSTEKRYDIFNYIYGVNFFLHCRVSLYY